MSGTYFNSVYADSQKSCDSGDKLWVDAINQQFTATEPVVHGVIRRVKDEVNHVSSLLFIQDCCHPILKCK